MRDLDPSQYAEADRRKVNPPIQVDSATWRLVARSTGGLKSAGNGWVAYAVMMADKGGSRLLIFVRRKRAAREDERHSSRYVEGPCCWSVTFLKSRKGNARPHSLPQRAYGPVCSTNHFNTSLR
jgi:hypothetical protein